jgi:multisubunit Na+/H+ antiporter MnhE subunit/multisubunit Na+/H+ antiporter MnhF subunit
LRAETDNASLSLARGAVTRATFFLAFWLMISGWAPTDFPVGLAAVVGATWVSLRFLPPKGSRLRVGSLAALAASFLRQSVLSGTDVAWRALNPRLRLDPALVACPLRLPPGGQRSAFCALSSLMPGTLPGPTKRARFWFTVSIEASRSPPISRRKSGCLSARSAVADFLLATAGVILFTVAVGLVRILSGPGDADRMMAAQLIGTGGIGSLLLIAAATGARGVEDVALGLALLAAFASAAFVNSAAPAEDLDAADGR